MVDDWRLENALSSTALPLSLRTERKHICADGAIFAKNDAAF